MKRVLQILLFFSFLGYSQNTQIGWTSKKEDTIQKTNRCFLTQKKGLCLLVVADTLV